MTQKPVENWTTDQILEWINGNSKLQDKVKATLSQTIVANDLSGFYLNVLREDEKEIMTLFPDLKERLAFKYIMKTLFQSQDLTVGCIETSPNMHAPIKGGWDIWNHWLMQQKPLEEPNTSIPCRRLALPASSPRSPQLQHHPQPQHQQPQHQQPQHHQQPPPPLSSPPDSLLFHQTVLTPTSEHSSPPRIIREPIVLQEPIPLPHFSPLLQERIRNGEIHQCKNLMVREVMEYYMSMNVEFTREVYNIIGKAVITKYPELASNKCGSKPWSVFSKKLSQCVRNRRSMLKKKREEELRLRGLYKSSDLPMQSITSHPEQWDMGSDQTDSIDDMNDSNVDYLEVKPSKEALTMMIDQLQSER